MTGSIKATDIYSHGNHESISVMVPHALMSSTRAAQSRPYGPGVRLSLVSCPYNGQRRADPVVETRQELHGGDLYGGEEHTQSMTTHEWWTFLIQKVACEIARLLLLGNAYSRKSTAPPALSDSRVLRIILWVDDDVTRNHSQGTPHCFRAYTYMSRTPDCLEFLYDQLNLIGGSQ
jgi:hypothetical protein